MALQTRVLVTAYTCEPGAGSEAGGGWAWARAAASRYEVVLLTRTPNLARIAEALADDSTVTMRIEVVDVPARLRRVRSRALKHLPQLVWQVRAGFAVRRLERALRFDVVHHVAPAIEWMPSAALWARRARRVWGPVGNGLGMPRAGWRWVGARGVVSEGARTVLLGAARATIGAAQARRADVVVAQNRDVAAYYRRRARSITLDPHAVVEPWPSSSTPRELGFRAIFVGRLIGWKGLRLAVEAVRRADARWTLDVYGDGPDRHASESFVRRRGLEHRVHFRGKVDRTAVLHAMQTADVMLATSLHESGGWAVTEALAAGCPIVALDRGGHSILLEGSHAVLISPMGGDLAGRFAAAIDSLPRDRPAPSAKWSASRLPALLAELYARPS